MDALKAFLNISRANIQVVSFASATMGVLLGASSFEEVLSLDVLIFILLFYTLITFACNVNCYFDVAVDRLRKKELAAAIMYLGSGRVREILVFEALAATLLSVFLFYRGHPGVAILSFLGLYLAWIYSAPPMRMKGKGLTGPLPVILGVYIMPVVAGYLLVNSRLTFQFLGFVGGYALMNLGINLVNTCEDYSEDRILGIHTTAHSLGLRGTLTLAFISSLAGGGAALVCLMGMGFGKLTHFSVPTTLALLFFLVTVFTVLFTSHEIMTVGEAGDLERSAKEHAGKMPGWFVITRYPMWLFALTLLFI